MKWTTEALRKLYQEETSPGTLSGPGCIPREVLVRAAQRVLNPHQRAQLADHLTTCSDCARQYRITLQLKPWVEKATEAVGRARPVDESRSGSRPTPLPSLTGSRSHRLGLWLAIAASVVIVSLVLLTQFLSLRRERERVAELSGEVSRRERTLLETREEMGRVQQQLEESKQTNESQENRIRELRRTVAELSRPYPNLPIFDLDPAGALTRGTATAVTPIPLPVDSRLFTVILNSSSRGQSFPSYELEILGGDGRAIWRGGGFRKTPAGNFTIGLPTRLFREGTYRFQLFGLKDGQRTRVEEYRVEFKLDSN
ncbi:MAG: hypothetical protein ACE5JX_16610 [Acidobacteriota bacterium]